MSLLLVLIILFSSSFLHAQEISDNRILLPDDIYMLPQTIYVGDRGRLVMPLGPAFNDAQAFVIDAAGELPSVNDLVINRMELERRSGNIRLIIDFIPYAPGVFILPPVLIPLGNSEPLSLSGIEFAVASILTPESMALSRSALPLAVPGTGLMVYGGLGVLLFLLIIGMLVFFRFSSIIEPLKRKWRQRRLLASLEQKIQFLRADNAGSNPDRNNLFSNLAGEFREFLSFISGLDCRVLSPYEFSSLSVAIPGVCEPDFFYLLFKRWDKLRFSGLPIKQEDIIEIIDKLELFFLSFIKAEKNQ